jgi:hypothetical protein
MLSREMQMALASKKAYRAMQEFDAAMEQMRETVEETDTTPLIEAIQRLAEETEPSD